MKTGSIVRLRAALIIQPGAVGDVILTLPLVRLLKSRLGLTRVDMMAHTEPLELLAGRSAIDRGIVIETVELHKLFEDPEQFDLPEGDRLIELFRPYEIIVTFLADPQGRFGRNLLYTSIMTHAAEVMELELKPPARYPGHVVGFYLRQFTRQWAWWEKWDLKPYCRLDEPLVFPDRADRERACRLLREKQLTRQKPTVALHPGSGAQRKCWPLKNYQRLAALLAEKGFQVVFLVGPVEQDRWGLEIIRDLDRQVPVLEGLTLPEVAGVLTQCRAYIGNDSGISHLAGAVGIPALIIFGASQARQWKPLGPCVHVCRVPGRGRPRWPSVETVLEELAALLD